MQGNLKFVVQFSIGEGLYQHLVDCSPRPWGLCVCSDLEEQTLRSLLAGWSSVAPHTLFPQDPRALGLQLDARSLWHCWPGRGAGQGQGCPSEPHSRCRLLALLIHFRNAALEPIFPSS